MVLVVSNETKLLFIPDKSFYPLSDVIRGERALNEERIILYSSNVTQV